MSKVFIEETSLSAIGDAIRAKTGKTELLSPAQMPTEIESIISGGEIEEIPEEAFTLTGDCTYMFSKDKWGWFIDSYGKKIKTVDITSAQEMFNNSQSLQEIPFTINLASSISTTSALSKLFYGCQQLRNVPYIDGSKLKPPISQYNGDLVLSMLFNGATRLREIPYDFFSRMATDEFWQVSQTFASSRSNIFNTCCSLRELPDITKIWNSTTSTYSSIYNGLLTDCYCLNSALIPTIRGTTVYRNSNLFDVYAFRSCTRLKDLIFDTDENNNPYVVNWANQVVDLSVNLGYCPAFEKSMITKYNSGITADKEVKDDATYQALKNDEDWYTTSKDYSRYNRISAVNTINSLPDASAYLAEAGGTNTIKFTGALGALTDGGAINTLTEEEIAVATVKGWTVSLV